MSAVHSFRRSGLRSRFSNSRLRGRETGPNRKAASPNRIAPTRLLAEPWENKKALIEMHRPCTPQNGRGGGGVLSQHEGVTCVRPSKIKLFKISDKSSFDYNLVFLLRKSKSTRLRAFVIIRLGGRVMKKQSGKIKN